MASPFAFYAASTNVGFTFGGGTSTATGFKAEQQQQQDRQKITSTGSSNSNNTSNSNSNNNNNNNSMMAAMAAKTKVALIGLKNAGMKTVIRALLQGRTPLKTTSVTAASNTSSTTTTEDGVVVPTTVYLVKSLKFNGGATTTKAKSNKDKDDDDVVMTAATDKENLIALMTFEYSDSSVEDRKRLKDFVSARWNFFDCVILVLDTTFTTCDGTADAESAHKVQLQLDLLKWTKTMLATEDVVPLVILGNKIDALDDSDEQVENACEQVTNLFQVSSRKRALQDLMKVIETNETGVYSLLLPAYIPTSALYADVHDMVASHHDHRQGGGGKLLLTRPIQPSDEAALNRIGKQELAGREWRKLKSIEEKCQVLWDRVFNDPEAVSAHLWASSFDQVRSILSYSLYDRMSQRAVVEHLLKKALQRMDWKSTVPLADQVRSIVSRKHKLYQNDKVGTIQGIEDSRIQQVFWDAYEKCEAAAVKAFDSPGKVQALWAPLEQLLHMGKLLREDTLFWQAAWLGEKDKVLNRMILIIRRQFSVVFEAFQLWNEKFDQVAWSTRSTWITAAAAAGTAGSNIPTWDVLTPPEWIGLLDSMRIPMQSSNATTNSFTNEIRMLNQVISRIELAWSKNGALAKLCPRCKRDLDIRNQRCGSCGQYWNKPWYCPDVDQCFACFPNNGNVAQVHHSRRHAAIPNNGLPNGNNSHKLIDGRCPRNNNVYWQPHPGCPEEEHVMGMEYDIETGVMVPVNPEAYNKLVCAQLLPPSLSDRKHFGHGVWKLAQFLSDSDLHSRK